MINANELRIGNLLIPTQPRHNEKYIAVYSINFEETNSDFREYSLVDLKPIPLTEEILLKCGIDNKFSIDIKAKKKNITFVWSSKIVTTGYRMGWKCRKYPHIKHLHQLQNLYFALTCQELEVNL